MFEVTENTTIRFEVIIAAVYGLRREEVFAQVLVNKFQYILNNYNGNELYDLKENTLNNIYEDIDNSNQYQK